MSYKKRYYSADPFWMKAKFNGICSCGNKINRGDDIYYFPKGKTAECEICGAKSAAILQDDIDNQTMCAM